LKNIAFEESYRRKLYEGLTLTDNLIKHASAPLIQNGRHPHPDYNGLQRIKIKVINKQLQRDIGKGYDEFAKMDLHKIHCQCPHKDKFMKIFETDVEDNDEAMCWTACRHTTLAAAKRQMKGAPTPEPHIADDFVKHSMNIIEKEIGDELSQFTYSVKDWYHHLSTKKQKALEPAMAYYYGDTRHLTKRQIKQLLTGKYSGILKEELQKMDGKPRNVCAIPQRTKYIMGPVTWALEDICAHKLQAYCGNKNLTQMERQINQYLLEGFTKVVEGDGSAFDNTQDVSLKELDRQIYNKIIDAVYHVPKEDFEAVAQALYKTMEIEEVKNGRRKVLLQYTVLGTVFSGDCDTTLMNTIRMAMYNRYVNDKAGLIYGVDYVCFSKGDDFTVMYKPYVDDNTIHKLYYKYFLPAISDASKPDTRIYGLGQVLKFLTISDASSLTFCSLRAWWKDPSETAIYLTRDPSKFYDIGKYSRKAKNYNMRQFISYCFDQEIALTKAYPKIRIFQYMAQQYHNLAIKLMDENHLNINDIRRYRTLIEQRNKREAAKQVAKSIYEQYLNQIEYENSEYVSHKIAVQQIQGEYWDYYKKLMEQHDEILTDDQASYINQQIENEFLLEYLKSMINIKWAQ